MAALPTARKDLSHDDRRLLQKLVEIMKLVIEMQLGNSAMKTYEDAMALVQARVGRRNPEQGPNPLLAKPAYGDGGPLIDTKQFTSAGGELM